MRAFAAQPIARRLVRSALGLVSVALVLLANPAFGRPRQTLNVDNGPAPVEVVPSFIVSGLAGTEVLDTTWYGGTVWAPDSSRWEAIRGGTWTFDTGVGSAIQGIDPSATKPAGYHRLMEGWRGLSYSATDIEAQFRRSTNCVITGGFSMWLGMTTAEVEAAGGCWAGPGYGNNWYAGLEQTFGYPGSGNVTLQFRYAVDSEALFDFLDVVVDPSGPAPAVVLASYDGVAAGLASFTLRQVDGTLPSGPGSVTIRFVGTSDGAYSDEDGYYTSSCGLASVDDIVLSGAITYATGFESNAGGWIQSAIPVVVDDFSDLRDVADLTTPSLPGLYLCPCGLRDSVLVFMDPNGQRPGDYPTGLAISPWIDLKAGGDVGRPGSLIRMNIDTGELGISPAVVTGAQYYPYVCPSTGRIGLSPIQWTSTIFFFGSPVCGMRTSDASYYAPPGAEQVRIVVGPIANNGMNESPPYIDNVRFGAYGPKSAPLVGIEPRYLLQDNFASDGTLNPGSTARFDRGYPTALSPTPYFGDTLSVSAGGQNVEVRLVFHARPGPFTSPGALAAAAARWTPEPALGGGWYSARMDTARFASANWMSCFHESDPGFTATDDAMDPNDPGHLVNDILPDNVFTPGSRIDYFIKARYRPPDPRNPGGDNWFITPDTTGSNFYEVEVLPSSMDADSTWNCVILANDYFLPNDPRQRLEQEAVGAVLGSGTANAEGTRFDRMDFKYRFARTPGTSSGATAAQLLGYQLVAWQNGQQFNNGSTNIDVGLLDTWLRTDDGVRRGFYGSGSVLVGALSGGSTTRAFLNNTLGVRLTCGAARSANCPSGTLLDSTWCLPLAAAPAPHFATPGALSVNGNGCPNLAAHAVLATEPAVAEARGNLQYVKNGAPAAWAAVSTDQPAGHDYRSVIDGFGLSTVRRSAADGHDAGQCANLTGKYERAFDVLGWLGSPACLSVGISDVPGPGTTAPSRPFLAPARPNPVTGSTTIAFTVATARTPTRIDLFDVTGRLVRRLVDGPTEAGTHAVTWDGRWTNGAPAAAGLYFYRMTTDRFTDTRKLLVVR